MNSAKRSQRNITTPRRYTRRFTRGPTHGVSGYPSTGYPGFYNQGFNTRGISYGISTPAASRYDIVATPNTLTMMSQSNTYNQSINGSLPRGQPVASFTSEPSWSASYSAASRSASSGTAPNQIQQSLGQEMGSSLRSSMFRGYYDGDLSMQQVTPSLDRNLSSYGANGDIVTPVHPVPSRLFEAPQTQPRQNLDESGTNNYTRGMRGVVDPRGQSNLHGINDFHTPQVVTAGYGSIGTHPAHGPSPAPMFDGSWSLQSDPFGTQPSLLSIPPAADIPVQTYSGDGPRSTSIYHSRPLSSGRLRTKTVAVMS